MSKYYTREQIQHKIFNYCAARECSTKQVKRKLLEWGSEPEYIDELLIVLITEDFINEERFCKAFVHDHLHLNQWGLIKIRTALRQEGCSLPNITQAVLSEWNEEKYIETIKKLAYKKQQTLRGKKAEQKQKIYLFLAQRGFESEYIALGLHSLEN